MKATNQDRKWFPTVIRTLSTHYKHKVIWREVNEAYERIGEELNEKDFYDPFKHIIIGILSQNTSDRNSVYAYSGLKKALGEITPKRIANADGKKIREAIRSGGLYNIKAKRIIEVSRYVLREYDGNLNRILEYPTEDALKKLLEIRGIGIKTAEVFLVYVGKRKLLPIDTNIQRVLWRLGVTSANDKYIEIQKKVRSVLSAKHYKTSHELLIRLGRDFCWARSPKCNACIVKKLCNEGRR